MFQNGIIVLRSNTLRVKRDLNINLSRLDSVKPLKMRYHPSPHTSPIKKIVEMYLYRFLRRELIPQIKRNIPDFNRHMKEKKTIFPLI